MDKHLSLTLRFQHQVLSAVAVRSILNLLAADGFQLPGTVEAPEPGSLLGNGRFGSTQLAEALEGERSCLIDGVGHVLLIAHGAEDLSPIRDSVLELIRAYSALRRHVLTHMGSQKLPHPRTCSILKKTAPDTLARAFLEFGAAGSFLEAKRKSVPIPLLMYLDGVDERVSRSVDALPAFYKQIGVNVGRFDPNLTFDEYAGRQLRAKGSAGEHRRDRPLIN